MFNTINNNQTIATNQPKYNTSVKNTLSACSKNFIRHTRVFALAIATVLTIIMANADTVKAENGCSKVPDNPIAFHFKDICNQHDQRYGTPWNTYRGFTYQTWKEYADKEFYESMKNRCDRDYSNWHKKGANLECKVMARVYYEGVQTYWGNKAYKNAQRKAINSSIAQYPNYTLYNGYYWTRYNGSLFYYQNGKWNPFK